jgi:protein-disulfide isomerase
MKKYLPLIIIAIVLVAALTSAAVLMRKKSGQAQPANVLNEAEKPATSSPGSADATAPSSSAEVSVPKPNVKVSSPVVLEEFGDYQCPPCGLLYPELKKIEDDYGNQLRIVFHHFPLTKIHKNALAAAHAAEAARNQDRFWQMHDRLYRNQKDWADLPDPRPVFVSYAQELGLNIDKFLHDMDSPEVDQRITADMEKGMSRGVNGTPTVFIDGQMLRAEHTTPEGVRRGINLMLERKAVS